MIMTMYMFGHAMQIDKTGEMEKLWLENMEFR